MMLDILLGIGGVFLTAAFSIIGWFFKMITNAIKEVRADNEQLRKSLSAHKLHASETFATKGEVEKGFDRVMTKLDKIDDKLDTKVDKENV